MTLRKLGVTNVTLDKYRSPSAQITFVLEELKYTYVPYLLAEVIDENTGLQN